jgi:alkanesulfonate monooxygenase SsuD/methylene tetrahydromethanopterin reductase-like flavin-dependent oxidoreductase (luciferase family)
VRALLRGATVETEGRYVRLRSVALDHPPRTVPPVSLGVRGPKSLRLSGRCADGTVLDASASPDDVAAARSAIDEGRSEAGRTDPHRLTVFTQPGGDRDAYAAAGADCLVFMSPDERLPLDLTRVFTAG